MDRWKSNLRKEEKELVLELVKNRSNETKNRSSCNKGRKEERN